MKLNLAEGHLGLFAYDGGSGMTFTGDWNNSAIQNTTGWYKVEVDWTTDHTHTVTLYQNGSEVTSFSYTESSSDPQHTATGVGFAGFLSSGETAQFDYAMTTSGSDNSEPIGKYQTIVNFNKALGLSPFDFDRGEAGAEIIKASEYSGPNDLGGVYNGRQGLKLSGENTEMISTSGLQNHPSAGDTFSCYFMPTGGGDNFNTSWAFKITIVVTT